MVTNPFFRPSDPDKKLLDELSAEARAQQRALGWTDEQIDANTTKTTKKRTRKPRA